MFAGWFTVVLMILLLFTGLQDCGDLYLKDKQDNEFLKTVMKTVKPVIENSEVLLSPGTGYFRPGEMVAE